LPACRSFTVGRRGELRKALSWEPRHPLRPDAERVTALLLRQPCSGLDHCRCARTAPAVVMTPGTIGAVCGYASR
jgi:hypothetical protein